MTEVEREFWDELHRAEFYHHFVHTADPIDMDEMAKGIVRIWGRVSLKPPLKP